MRRTTILPLLAAVLLACGRGSGDGDHGGAGRAGGAGEPGQAEAPSGASGKPATEPVPFAPRSAERRAQDSVLRTSRSADRKRLKPAAASAQPDSAR
jgi:hypothetical protein